MAIYMYVGSFFGNSLFIKVEVMVSWKVYKYMIG